MKTAEQTIFIWGKTTEQEVIDKVKKSIQDFDKIGLEPQEIKIFFQDKEDGDTKTINEEKK
jgi:hypothetical protein